MSSPTIPVADVLTAYTTLSISGIDLQVQLHSITNAVILQRQHVLERPFPLPLQHYLVRFAADPHGDHGFESSCYHHHLSAQAQITTDDIPLDPLRGIEAKWKGGGGGK